MSKHILRAVALAAALLPATWAVAAPLSLDQAVDLAAQRSQMARSARAGAMSAAEMARAAGQQPDPMLSVGIDNLPATGSNRFSTRLMSALGDRVAVAGQLGPHDRERHAMTVGDEALIGAEANELMLFDREKLFSSEQGWGPVLNLLFPRGLMLMDFDHHRMDRRAYQPFQSCCSAAQCDQLGQHVGLKRLQLDIPVLGKIGLAAREHGQVMEHVTGEIFGRSQNTHAHHPQRA